MVAEDPDFHRRDLLRGDRQAGDAPEWRLEMQIMPFADAADYRFNPFDLTKVWPHDDYPPITVGRMVLDRNPENYFAEVEQAAFEPANLVPGIGPSPDKMLLGRLFSYPDTHRYRIGANYEQLPDQRAEGRRALLQQGRARCATATPATSRSMRPTAYGGPQADPASRRPSAGTSSAGEIGRYAYEKHADDDDFGQAGTLYRDVMNDTDREHLAANIAGHASDRVSDEIQHRVIAYWTMVDAQLGAAVAAGLGKGNGASAEPGATRAAELVAGRANRA